MRAELSNFIGVRRKGLPILSVPVENGKFDFHIKHTTTTYDVSADGVIDIESNVLIFFLSTEADTPNLDQHVAKQAFDDLKPHVDLYCPNKKCKHHYHLSSYIFEIKRHPNLNVWIISPLKLFLESFKAGNLNVQNDWRKEETNIYSLINEDAEPIKFPIIDFEEMGKDKLLTRIQTLVTFS
jgi:hypothetical protein